MARDSLNLYPRSFQHTNRQKENHNRIAKANNVQANQEQATITKSISIHIQLSTALEIEGCRCTTHRGSSKHPSAMCGNEINGKRNIQTRIQFEPEHAE